MAEEKRGDEFGGRPFTSEERAALHYFAEHQAELQKMIEVSRAKALIYDGIIKIGAIAGVITTILGLIFFWRSGGGSPQ